MKLNKICFLLLFLVIFISCCFATEPVLNSTATMLIDSNTGFVLHSKNPEQKIYPASTTKVLTTIIAIENLDLKVITYGFNSKSTVTASSITEEEMLICVQRNIINIKGKKIEPQEINIEKDIMLDNYDNMYIMCLATIYGKM